MGFGRTSRALSRRGDGLPVVRDEGEDFFEAMLDLGERDVDEAADGIVVGVGQGTRRGIEAGALGVVSRRVQEGVEGVARRDATGRTGQS